MRDLRADLREAPLKISELVHRLLELVRDERDVRPQRLFVCAAVIALRYHTSEYVIGAGARPARSQDMCGGKRARRGGQPTHLERGERVTEEALDSAAVAQVFGKLVLRRMGMMSVLCRRTSERTGMVVGMRDQALWEHCGSTYLQFLDLQLVLLRPP